MPSTFADTTLRTAFAQVLAGRCAELDRLDHDVDVWRALDLDSLDHLTVITQISDATGVDIPERSYPRLISLRQLGEHIDHATGRTA